MWCFQKILVITTVLLAVVGCPGGLRSASLNPRALVLWPSTDGAYRFQEINFLSTSDPSELASDRVKMYWRAPWQGRGFAGSVAKPHWLRSGDLWIPQDVQSATAAGAFLIFERLFEFDQQLGVEKHVSWPRLVAIDEPVTSSRGAVLDNAFYDRATNTTVVTRLASSQLPIGLSHGVLAHEHFHAHFEAAWRQALHHSLVSPPDANSTLSPVLAKNIFYLNAWNEGLADFYAATFSGQPRYGDWVSASSFSARHVDGELRPFQRANSEDIYEIGTTLARWLYAWQRAMGNKSLLGMVMRPLPSWLEEWQRLALTPSGDRILSGDWLFEKMVANAEADDRARICPEIQRVMPVLGERLCP